MIRVTFLFFCASTTLKYGMNSQRNCFRRVGHPFKITNCIWVILQVRLCCVVANMNI